MSRVFANESQAFTQGTESRGNKAIGLWIDCTNRIMVNKLHEALDAF